MTMREAVEPWLAQLGSKTTRRVYRSCVLRFLDVVGEDLSLESVSRYMASLSGMWLRTEHLHVAAVRSFLRWCMESEVIPKNWEHVIRHRKDSDREREMLERRAGRRKYLTPAEAGRLLEAARAAGPRHHATVAGLLGTGMRVAELAHAKWSHVRVVTVADVAYHELEVIRKGAKVDRVPLHPFVMEAWTALGGEPGDPHHVIHHTKERAGYSIRGLQHLVYVAATRAELEGVHPHTLRHTVASQLAADGSDVWEIMAQLGHSTPATATTYVHDMRELPQRLAVLERLPWIGSR